MSNLRLQLAEQRVYKRERAEMRMTDKYVTGYFNMERGDTGLADYLNFHHGIGFDVFQIIPTRCKRAEIILVIFTRRQEATK